MNARRYTPDDLVSAGIASSLVMAERQLALLAGAPALAGDRRERVLAVLRPVVRKFAGVGPTTVQRRAA